MSPNPAPMTLFNMRASGVRTLAVWCLGRGCNHESVLDVSAYPDDVRLSARHHHAALATFSLRAH